MAQPRTVPETGRESRAAIVVPIYNEDPHDVFMRINAVHDSLRRTDHAHRFDIFVLSDSTDAETWIAEELAWHELCRKVDGFGRIFYRHRTRNIRRKSGNIADFCENWGAYYEYMVVFDADSLMEGETLAEMVDLMDAHPQVGLIQVPPVPVGQQTVFARLQQFAASLYGPVYATGIAFWYLGDSSYWGHNAIIRTRAFIDHCGLPDLPGKEPLGGEILSHDFVEAALLRRAGWEVWMVPELQGSYEETPPTLIDHAMRDRRWCQGNLQHARLVFTKGLHAVSRIHLAHGVMSYASSPLWLLFLIVAGVEALRQTRAEPIYFLGDSIFPAWPPSYTMEATVLLAITLTGLYTPKVLGLILTLRDPASGKMHGGLIRATFSMVLESLVSVLLAPILMLFQTRFVLSTLAGRTVSWNPQRRDADHTSLPDAFAAHGWQTAIAAAIGWVTWTYVPIFFWWLTPVLAGPILAIPISMLSSRRLVGGWLRRRRLLAVPAETSPSGVLRDFDQIRAAEPAIGDGNTLVQKAFTDAFVNTLHVSLQLPVNRPRSERHYLAFLAQRLREEGVASLNPDEVKALLGDPDSMLATYSSVSDHAVDTR